MDDRLYRSRTDRIITGVAGGLAERMDVDPSLVRVVWVLLTIVSGGIFALIYIVMAVVVPERPAGVTSSRTGSVTPPAAPSPGSWIGPDGQAVPAAAPGPAADERHKRTGVGAIIFGGILITIGVWTLVERYVPGIDTSTIWPIVVIVLGIGLIGLAFLRPSRG